MSLRVRADTVVDSLGLDDEVEAGESRPWLSRQWRWIWFFIALGAAARLLRYGLRFPFWGDESLISVNFLNRGYLDLLQPLDAHQVAPLLFLWIEATAVRLFAFSEYSLRAWSCVGALASLLLFPYFARQLLRGTALVLAIAVFAVSYPCIRYAAEVKPYGGDVLMALVLMTLTVRWWRQPEQTRWLWGLVGVTPLAIGVSYPAVFVAGGVSLVVAGVLWQTSVRRGWLPWVVYNLVLLASFGLFFVLVAGRQMTAESTVMTDFWRDAFPPLDSPIALASWLFTTHTSDMLAHPVGGEHCGSILTAVLCIVGLAVLCRRRQYRVLALCLLPAALNFVAAAMHRYPYGGHVRMAMHLAPAICLLTGLGAAALVEWRRPGARVQWPSSSRLRAALIVLALICAVSIGRDLYRPAKADFDLKNRAFTQWFWNHMTWDRELVCLRTDLGLSFPKPGHAWYCGVSEYLCYQRIYSPRHARGEPAHLDRVSVSRSLCCVQYRSGYWGYDETRFAAWLETMKIRYDLVGTDRYPLIHGRVAQPENVDYVEVYKFIPKSPPATR
jgi:hypothetical protein